MWEVMGSIPTDAHPVSGTATCSGLLRLHAATPLSKMNVGKRFPKWVWELFSLNGTGNYYTYEAMLIILPAVS